jgi:hypothetical protein
MILALIHLMQHGDTAAAAAAIDRGGQRTHVADVLLGQPLVARTMAYRYGERIAPQRPSSPLTPWACARSGSATR